RRPFTHHQVAVQPGDCVYLTTDGFIDQFGGPENRKFMKKPFKQMLQELGTVS
ncbi:MAG TPA: histidine kinase, partial [Cytophagales bacterium]|nr:histidine kinase [Cytophagales bacterium]